MVGDVGGGGGGGGGGAVEKCEVVGVRGELREEMMGEEENEWKREKKS
jgi:hypothetical protein